MTALTLKARLEAMTPAEFSEAMEGIAVKKQNVLVGSWYSRARASQVVPPGDWHTWLVMAGRGFGKTRTGAEWVQRAARNGGARIAIVGTTLHEARAVMVEGESGLLRVRADWRPEFEPSLRRLSWPTGAKGFLYSADDPDAMRGAQHSHAYWAGPKGTHAQRRDSRPRSPCAFVRGKPRAFRTTRIAGTRRDVDRGRRRFWRMGRAHRRARALGRRVDACGGGGGDALLDR